MSRIIIMVLLAFLSLFVVAGWRNRTGEETINLRANMKISSSTFVNGERMKSEYTCDGENVNPDLEIEGVSAEAKSFVLIMDDIDAPSGVFTHWLVYDIPPSINKIARGSKPPGTEGINSFGQVAYGGPCPHGGVHRYYFRIWELDVRLGLPAGVERKRVEEAMQGHVIGSAVMLTTYSR